MDFLTIVACTTLTVAAVTCIYFEFTLEQEKYLKRKYERIADLQAKLGEEVYDKYDFEQLSNKDLVKLDRRLTKALQDKRQSELDVENRQILENLL